MEGFTGAWDFIICLVKLNLRPGASEPPDQYPTFFKRLCCPCTTVLDATDGNNCIGFAGATLFGCFYTVFCFDPQPYNAAVANFKRLGPRKDFEIGESKV